MGVHTSALDTTFTSDVGSSGGLHLALDNGNSRSFGQFPWNFSLFDLTSNLSNLGDLGALGNYPIRLFAKDILCKLMVYEHNGVTRVGMNRDIWYKICTNQSYFTMKGLSPSEYILRAVSEVKTNVLEQTILALPFADALKILAHVKDVSLNPDKAR
ncbi:G-protein beta WD-40 repeat-containing protein [Tanacetum coccineum]